MIAENKIMATKDSILATAEKKAKKRRAAKPEKLPFQIAMQDNLLPFACPKCSTGVNFRYDALFQSPPEWIGWGVVGSRAIICKLAGIVHWRALIGRVLQDGLCWDKEAVTNGS